MPPQFLSRYLHPRHRHPVQPRHRRESPLLLPSIKRSEKPSLKESRDKVQMPKVQPSPPPSLSLNGPDALSAYRHSPNPLTSGPDLMPTADTLPEGEFNVRFYVRAVHLCPVFRFRRDHGTSPGFSQTQLIDLFAMLYGVDINTEFVFLPSVITTFSNTGGSSERVRLERSELRTKAPVDHSGSETSEFFDGVAGDSPDNVLARNPRPCRWPPTHQYRPLDPFRDSSLYGDRHGPENIKPLKLYSDLYYTWSVPGNISAVSGEAPAYSQFGDLFQYRVGIEDVVDDKSGLGFILEIAGLSGLPFSLDGIGVNTHPSSFNLVGIQPTIEYNLTSRLAASFGVLFPAFGNNEYLATTPSFSLWYYFLGPQGKLLPR